MGFTEVLTLVFVVLKLTGVIAWSWWWVLSPTIICFVLVFLFFVIIGVKSPSRRGRRG